MVAVEVAHDRITPQRADDFRVDFVVVIRVEPPVAPSNSPTSSPLAALPSKLPATGKPLMFAGSLTTIVRHAVVIGVDDPTILRADLAVGGQLVEAVGRCGPDRAEVAGEHVVGGEAEAVDQVAVGEIEVVGIEDRVAVGVYV